MSSIYKQWYINITDYYSAIKKEIFGGGDARDLTQALIYAKHTFYHTIISPTKKKPLIHPTTWTDLKSI